MTAAEILNEVAARGFRVGLNSTGEGLILWPGHDPPADLVNLIRGAKPEIVAHLQTECRRINHWIANQIIDWPLSSCLHCRKAIIPGQQWVDVASGDVTARFHEPCHPQWLAQQEVAARKAIGLK
jgi:hypothetical protein